MKFNVVKIVNLLVLCAIASTGQAFAQKGKSKTSEPQTVVAEVAKSDPTADAMQHYRQIYDAAIGYNDFAVATDAMYHMIALRPTDAALKDTLAGLYFQRGAWPQVVLVTTDILLANATNQAALELRAVANQSIGRAKEALADYEQLYKLAQNPYHLYEIAALQFSMKRLGECELTVRQLLADGSLKDKTIAITVQDGRSQEVPLHAAALNLNGVLDLEQGKKDSAKVHFENALKVYPDFILASDNLAALVKIK
jgi:tetratricopeptide (TPR) repeat protein